MVLKSIKDPAELTLGEAEELRAAGAYLEMCREGFIYVFEGGTELEGDADNLQ